MGGCVELYRLRIGLHHAHCVETARGSSVKGRRVSLGVDVLLLVCLLVAGTAVMCVTATSLLAPCDACACTDPNLHRVSRHLQLCGDIEQNPGPPKMKGSTGGPATRQSSRTSGKISDVPEEGSRRRSVDSGNPSNESHMMDILKDLGRQMNESNSKLEDRLVSMEETISLRSERLENDMKKALEETRGVAESQHEMNSAIHRSEDQFRFLRENDGME